MFFILVAFNFINVCYVLYTILGITGFVFSLKLILIVGYCSSSFILTPSIFVSRSCYCEQDAMHILGFMCKCFSWIYS